LICSSVARDDVNLTLRVAATWPAHTPGVTYAYNHANMYTVDYRPPLCQLCHFGLISEDAYPKSNIFQPPILE